MNAARVGYVFVDADGDTWGATDDWRGRGCGQFATHPFRTKATAKSHATKCIFPGVTVRAWREGDSVPPMPSGVA